MAYQSLYRRYRSKNFEQVKGQPHVTSALKTAVAEGRHGHAYLFSGPRGTGKTSTARVLAKALNCEEVLDGEPCTTCDSCLSIDQGRSFDLHELDAASNNKVDDIRDLIAKVQLGSPGRTKVYILDEVHMLTTGAENALLKTLEEPPDHVVFVLATTEPHKVVPTIRSRTQHFEFHLLPADDLAAHVAYVVEDAGLDVDSEGLEYALAQGGGSARDTLSALDLVAAAGGAPNGSDNGVALVRAIGAGDAQQSIRLIQEGLISGLQPRLIGEQTLNIIRDAFLCAMGASLEHLSDTARTEIEDLANKLTPATLTRSMELIGQALIEIRQAPDPRVPLEVAVLRLTRPEGDDTSALLQRLEVIEARLDKSPQAASSAEVSVAEPSAPDVNSASNQSELTTPGGPAQKLTTSTTTLDSGSPSRRPKSPRSAAQAANQASVNPGSQDPTRVSAKVENIASVEPAKVEPAKVEPEAESAAAAPNPESTVPDSQTSAQPSSGTARSPSTMPSVAVAAEAVETRLDGLSQKARVRFKGGKVTRVEGCTVYFAVPNQIHCDRCAEVKGDVEQALSTHFGSAITLNVVVDGQALGGTVLDPAKLDSPGRSAETTAAAAETNQDIGPVSEMQDANDVSSTGVDRLTKAFPGSKVIESPTSE